MTTHRTKHAGKHHEHASRRRPPHKDWRAWVIVGLMLAAIVAYVASLDESIFPGGEGELPRVPAAAP